MEVRHKFVNYGKELNPEPGVLVLDVGKRTVPGVIDHHHPDAEAECAASLIIKYPSMVVDHLRNWNGPLDVITHRLPDFDAVASIFLSLKLLEIGRPNESMVKIAAYTKMVDSASLPKDIDLASTPYSILRALFSRIRGSEEEINFERVREGLKFMRFLYDKSEEGYDLTQNKLLFSGIDRYERAMRKVENDYFNYLADVRQGQKIALDLPLVSGGGTKRVDGLIVRNPKSFLLKEWAQRDRENSPLGEGFSFLLTNFGDMRYILGVDPEKGLNLKGLGNVLNQGESEKRAELQRAFPLPWYDGNCPFFNYRIIDSPQDETALDLEEIVELILSYSKNLKAVS